jgi:hypothetical protein
MTHHGLAHIPVAPGLRQILREHAEHVAGDLYRWSFLETDSGRRYAVRADTLLDAVEKAARAISTGGVIWRR